MTIFGFNTDVRHEDVLYHVQSEARQNDLLLQTLIFVKGQCVGKHTVSYAQKLSEEGFSTEAMHELLKGQHKGVLDAIQRGDFGAVLGSGAEVQDVGGNGLSLKWVSSAAEGDNSGLTMKIEVLDSGHPASGAEIAVYPCTPPDAPALCSVTSDATGSATFRVPLNEDALRESAVMIRAGYRDKSATRKARFKR
jgi:hypothetical protein